MVVDTSPEQKIISAIWESGDAHNNPQILRTCDLNLLSQQLVNAATLTSKFDHRFIDYLYSLTIYQTISWPQFIRALCSFKKFEKSKATTEIAKWMIDIIPNFKLDPFIEANNSDNVFELIVTMLNWAFSAVKDITSDYKKSSDDDYLCCISVILKILQDKFCSRILGVYNNNDLMKNLSNLTSSISEKPHFPEVAKEMVSQIEMECRSMNNVEEFVFEDSLLTLYKRKNTCIRVLTTIFSCYRVLVTADEVADTYHVFSQLMSISFVDVVYDMMHSTLLIKTEEVSDLPFLPKVYRINYRWRIASFFNIKMSKIWSILIRKYNYQRNDVAVAINKVINELTMTLNIVDKAWSDCSIYHLTKHLVQDNVLDQETADSLISQRYRQMRQDPELDRFTRPTETERQATDLYMMNKSQFPRDGSMTKKEVILKTMCDICRRKDSRVPDALLAYLCVNEEFLQYTHQTALINSAPHLLGDNISQQIEYFNTTFLVLSRIVIHYPYISTATVVSGGSPINSNDDLRNGVFYKWTNKYKKRVQRTNNYNTLVLNDINCDDNSKEVQNDEKMDTKAGKEELEQLPCPTNEEANEMLAKLKMKQPYWNINSEKLDFESIVYAIPSICELILEEYNANRRGDALVGINTDNIVAGIQKMPCLLVCMIQWLDMQPDSMARRAFAKSLYQSLEEISKFDDTNWTFILSMVNDMLKEMSEKPPVYPEVGYTAFSKTRRYCPKVARSEVPDIFKLKSAWYFMQMNQWASPHALKIIEHSNKAGDYIVWESLYLNKVLSLGCSDLILKGYDMILAYMTLDFHNCLIRVHEILLEFWIFDKSEMSRADLHIDASSIFTIFRLSVWVMELAAWALEVQTKKLTPVQLENFKIMAKNNDQIETPDVDDPNAPEKWAHLLSRMIDVTFNRFLKIVRKGSMSPVVCGIAHILRMIAGSPNTTVKQLLMKRIPLELVFELSYIYPSAVSYEMFNTFCDPHSEQHRNYKVRFLCSLRCRNII